MHLVDDFGHRQSFAPLIRADYHLLFTYQSNCMMLIVRLCDASLRLGQLLWTCILSGWVDVLNSVQWTDRMLKRSIIIISDNLQIMNCSCVPYTWNWLYRQSLGPSAVRTVITEARQFSESSIVGCITMFAKQYRTIPTRWCLRLSIELTH